MSTGGCCWFTETRWLQIEGTNNLLSKKHSMFLENLERAWYLFQSSLHHTQSTGQHPWGYQKTSNLLAPVNQSPGLHSLKTVGGSLTWTIQNTANTSLIQKTTLGCKITLPKPTSKNFNSSFLATTSKAADVGILLQSTNNENFEAKELIWQM